jgi:hypothetical protein
LLGGVEGCNPKLSKTATVQPTSQRPTSLAGLLEVTK